MPGNYSTSEIDTGYTWIDGSAIYKKTVNTGALPNNTGKHVAHNISNVQYVIHMGGWAYNNTDYILLPGVATNPITMSADATYIHITATSDRSAYATSYVTLYYTKSS